MIPIASRLAATLLILFLAPTVLSQDVVCRRCEHKGQKECKKHGRDGSELEEKVLHCSVAAKCRSCAGALTLDCKSCRNAEAEQSAERRKQLAAQFVAGRKTAVDDVVEHGDLMHLKTAHVDLTFSIPPMTVGKRKLDTHRLMHLYGERIETMRAEFLRIFGRNERDAPARLQIFLVKDRRDHARLAPRFTGGGANGIGQKLMGSDAVYCMVLDRSRIRNDADLHRNVAHNVAHLLLANMSPAVWIGNRKRGWIDAGVAHWFEDKVDRLATNFCYEEVGLTAGLGFHSGKWRPGVRKLVEEGKNRTFAALANLNTDQLSMPDHAVAFAYVDMLIRVHGGPKFAEFVVQIKKGVKTAEAMRKALGRSILSIDEDFVKWVRENYSLRDR